MIPENEFALNFLAIASAIRIIDKHGSYERSQVCHCIDYVLWKNSRCGMRQ